MHLDRNGVSDQTQDIDYEFTNDDHSLVFRASFPAEHGNQTEYEAFRTTPGGKLFVQGGIQSGLHTNINQAEGFVVACPALFKTTVQHDGAVTHSANLTLQTNLTFICGPNQTDLIGRVATLEAAGGGGGLSTLDISTTGGSGTNKSAWPAIANHTKISLTAGVTRYRCPHNPAEGDEIHIRWTADSHISNLVLGTVGNTFNYYSQGTYQSNTQMSLMNPHVQAKLVVRFEHGEWIVHLKTHSGSGRYHKSFSHTATHTIGNPFQLPSGYMDYTVILGDNSDYVNSGSPAFNAQTFGCYVRLPFYVHDGAKCHFETHLDLNSSSTTEVITVQADLFANKKLRDEFGTLFTANPSYKEVRSTIHNTRSFDFVWSLPYNTWIIHQETN
jgi:hypothetical protein